MMTNLIILAPLSAKGDGPNAPVNGYFVVTCTGLGRLRRFRRKLRHPSRYGSLPNGLDPVDRAGLDRLTLA
jgi:hypothetical protein